MGIMVLMLALAGQVMNMTVRATGVATSYTEVNQALRALEQTLREDLRHVHPGQSLMLIQGNPINAYWTRDQREADDDATPEPSSPRMDGYPHRRDPERERPEDSRSLQSPRADILMFFTTRKATNYVQYSYRQSGGAPPSAVSSNIQQVVYGHANLGEYVASGAGIYVFQQNVNEFPVYPQVAPIPADRWHLARRVAHLLPNDKVATTGIGTPKWVDYLDASRLDLPEILSGETDVIVNFDYQANVLTSMPRGTIKHSLAPLYWPSIFDGGAKPFERSRLDPTPPPALAGRLGHYLLPNCASFKVEWTLDPRGAFVSGQLNEEKDVSWFDPGHQVIDPANPGVLRYDPLATMENARKRADDIGPPEDVRAIRLNRLLGNPVGGDLATGEQYSLRERFGSSASENLDPDHWASWHADRPYATNPPRPNIAVFTANRNGSPEAPVADDIFPKALRITVDVVDDARRLDPPVRHVMVLPVGG